MQLGDKSLLTGMATRQHTYAMPKRGWKRPAARFRNASSEQSDARERRSRAGLKWTALRRRPVIGDVRPGDLPGPAGHHGACHRGAMFRTRRRVLLPAPATIPACPGGAMFLRHSVDSGTRRADWQRRQCRLNTAPRWQAAWWRGYAFGGSVSGAEHRSTEASSAVAAEHPLTRSFGSQGRPLRSRLSAIAFPESTKRARPRAKSGHPGDGWAEPKTRARRRATK